ncbi:unnamed protein product [Cladocopium goreaui]|uniref:Uncharacterized protein n=1 Tax=Cladocopium goreaui TaxID=2562237 RepID=A0A9P1FXR7_9DINO|nr:unnamed protein product [Cladocopium goreaui]
MPELKESNNFLRMRLERPNEDGSSSPSSNVLRLSLMGAEATIEEQKLDNLKGGEEQDDVPENDAGRGKQSLTSPGVNDEADLKQEIQISRKGQDKITLKPLLPQRLVQIPIVT